MARYRLTGLVTISVHLDVEAKSEAEARRKAADAPMQTLCIGCSGGEHDAWSTSGELDGEVHIESVEPARARRQP